MATYAGFCVKCRTKKQFEGSVVMSKSNRPRATGPCPDCGTNVNTFLKKDAA